MSRIDFGILTIRMPKSSLSLSDKFAAISATLTERALRLWAAAEARSLGHGGIKEVADVTGLSRRTIGRGIKELVQSGESATATLAPHASRRPGAGRKKLVVKTPELLSDLTALVDPATRGHPESPLLWTAKSTVKLAEELQRKGHRISERTVASLLKENGYSLQAMRKTKEGGRHEDRNAQFEHIARLARKFRSRGQPVISVDAKKKELVGTFANKGQEWQPKGHPEQANVYDFVDEELGKVTPYGVYDLHHNMGWVSVGIDHDTAEFAVETVRRWWKEMGKPLYPDAARLMITADGGGSNGSRVRLWKVALQKFAQESGLEIHVCHFPPGTSKWNKIEHRMFSYVSLNWRGRALATRQIIVSLIGQTTTKTGLLIRAALDEGKYPTGKKVTNEEMATLNLKRHTFRPNWNYSLAPK
jgi:transposase